jgi:hypothetical protein
MMRKMDDNRKGPHGISFPVVVVVMAMISVAATSSVVMIGMEIADSSKEDEILDPFFHMRAEPMHQDATTYETVNYTIWFDTEIYLYTPIQLHVEDMFDGVISDIYPTTIYPGENATLELTAILEGDFFREVVGTYQGLKDKVRVTLSVEDGSVPGEFSLSARPEERTVFPNELALFEITLDSDKDFQGSVELTVLDAYDGVISCIYPSEIAAGEKAILGLYGMFPGDFTRTILGTCGERTSEVQVELHVMMETYIPE